MEPNTNPEVTNNEERRLPFVFQGLGFFLMNEEADEGDFYKERVNPRDINHLSKRSYRYLAYPFQTELVSSEAPDSGSIHQTNLQTQQTASVSLDDHSLHLGEVAELSDDECVTHYNRLLGGDFPWEKLSTLVHAGLERKDMSIDDCGEWQQIYDLHSQFCDSKTQDTSNIEQKRLIVHEILLWTLALDYFYDFPESEGIIEAMDKECLTLVIVWEDIVVLVKLLNGNLLPEDNGEGSENRLSIT